jgi:hypothetical protein
MIASAASAFMPFRARTPIAARVLGMHVRTYERSAAGTSDDVAHDQRITGPCWFTASPTTILLAQHLSSQPAVRSASWLERC